MHEDTSIKNSPNWAITNIYNTKWIITSDVWQAAIGSLEPWDFTANSKHDSLLNDYP